MSAPFQPWPQQVEAANRLLRGHYGLWWGAGCGKTGVLAMAGRDTGQPQLWLTSGAELREQTARDLPHYRGDNPRLQVLRTSRDLVDPRADVVMATYDLARVEAIWRQLFRLAWGSIALDEAQALKDTAAVRTRALYGARQDSKGALYRRATMVWPASGTPILSNTMEVYSHVSRLWPHLLPEPPTKDGWMAQYCVTAPGDYGLRIVGARNVPELRAKLLTCGEFRDLDLASMPPLLVDDIPLLITPEDQRRLRATMDPAAVRSINAVLAMLEGGEALADAQINAELLPTASVRRVLALLKAAPLTHRLRDELDGGLDRVVVFGTHREALARVAAGLERYGCGLATGETSPRDRDDMIRRFAAGDLRVLVMNQQIGGVGLNLQTCRRVVFLEAAWVPGLNTQALRRCYRAGQRRPVHVSFAGVAGSLDEDVSRVLARKARVIQQLTGFA